MNPSTTEKQTESSPQSGKPSPQARQVVNFLYYKVTGEYKRLPEAEKKKAQKEFNDLVDSYRKDMIIISYTNIGIRADCDFLIWRICRDLELFNKMSGEINRTVLGHYLTTAYSFISMTKHSTYVDKHSHVEQEGRRLTIYPGKSKFLFVYPFVKTREWYLLPKEKRQEMMDAHIAIGHKFASVKINTTYSFGLDDQEFVVAFETDRPDDFLDLVMALREIKGSIYTLRDTPIFTCLQQPLPEILESLG